MNVYRDSTNQAIEVGDKVMFRGKIYTIANFLPGLGRLGSAVVEFVEDEIHTDETPDELSVDRVDG